MSSRDVELSDLCEEKFCVSNWMAPVWPRARTPAGDGTRTRRSRAEDRSVFHVLKPECTDF